MDLLLQQSKIPNQKLTIAISGSKSETNRLLLLQALYPQIVLKNESNSDDSKVMVRALTNWKQNTVVDIHHAGTAMRFLTSFFAVQEGAEVMLTGSERMKERPVKILVDALNSLEADVTYKEKTGFPPLYIKGKKIVKNQVTLAADVSSQYVSALLLIAPKLENGLEVVLSGQMTSKPYISMTLALLKSIGVVVVQSGNAIKVSPLSEITKPLTITVESDWSSVSYYYSLIALSEIGTQIMISSFKKDSLQGDAALVTIYEKFGVQTTFEKEAIVLEKITHPIDSVIQLQLNNCPDIAQTIAVTCFGLGISCLLEGLHTLKIKETDRLEALKNELTKLGADISVTNDSLFLEASEYINTNTVIKTYQDHRMAMAFAPLALKTNIVIEEAEVVSKSYPDFWKDMESIGIRIEKK